MANGELLIRAIEDPGYTAEAYSGRGMYGKQCISFTVEPEQNVLAMVAEIVAAAEDGDERDELVSAFSTCRTDSMGLGSVVYFPRYSWQAEEAASNVR